MPQFLANLPYTAIEAAIASGKPCVAVLPVGATEAHGPHLPMATDVIISEAFAACACDTLDKSGKCHAFMLPALSYTPADYAGEFAGTISMRWETLAATLDDIAASLKRHSFACLAIANSHFDPGNVNVLRQAAERIAKTGLKVAYADATRKALAQTLGDEFKTGDCHGGEFESSIVLATKPALVDDVARKKLPDNYAGLLTALKPGSGKSTFKQAGMTQAYCGAPANASARAGEAYIATLAGALVLAVSAALSDVSTRS